MTSHHVTLRQTGGKTTGAKHAFEVDFCAKFLLDGISPVGFLFTCCF